MFLCLLALVAMGCGDAGGFNWLLYILKIGAGGAVFESRGDHKDEHKIDRRGLM